MTAALRFCTGRALHLTRAGGGADTL